MASSNPYDHRSHDYRLLVKRWKAFCKDAKLKLQPFACSAEEHIYFIETARELAAQGEPWIYISAGVHGDESAPPWGLLEWAEAHVDLLRRHPFLIFPVLNPTGLILNTRADYAGMDLNRNFNHPSEPVVASWRKVIKGRKLAIGLCLHEDYDGQGCYLYELNGSKHILGERILADTSVLIPKDCRKRIDGRAAKAGLIRRKVIPEMTGQPEAIVLHLHGAPITLTFESPSEFCIVERIAVQKRFIESSLKHALGLT
ncbi:succinylglutamate desuccinylase/aspartoacylase family protein [Roseimicrobium gellanilyticum]|uniref:Succinylglutamate desuccinylase/aspartoacylase family protein n=1 Tax=Roseimicrobium gellanilyticum TaxID=748857 RepID=A0A366HSF0_9BACT|nr:M14 family metallocarboxypeptidase [Roseimicrobium gellanilyticum]RBP47211.1 succinylglutamate desuccinylase/aspartoacylase family protein [Roseimicrobium gellanilyticum]